VVGRPWHLNQRMEIIDKFVQRLSQRGILGKILQILRGLGLLSLAFGLYEKLTALNLGADKNRGVQAASVEGPVPPPELIVQVAGTPNVEWFLSLGRDMFQAIVTMLREDDAPAEEMQRILEFGCGCGRVLRYWRGIAGPAIFGTDYNPRMIEWCRRNLPFARTSLNDLLPPLPYADHMFDCIYATSVFTHLSAELQALWMRELGRILKPGGRLLITTHGKSYRARLNPSELADFDAGRLLVRYEETSGTNLCSAFHPETYVRKHLAAGYTVRDFVPAGGRQGLYQDMYLLRKFEG
jgi:SAM-dependent methyltransferase